MIKPRCQHFGKCGGCSLQNLSYGDQLKAKEKIVHELLAPFNPKEFCPIMASPETWHYRNKMELAWAGQDQKARLAFRVRDCYNRFVSLEECHLFNEKMPRLLASLNRWAKHNEYKAWNPKKKEGFLKFLTLREGKNTEESLIVLGTSGPCDKELLLDIDGFLDAVKEAGFSGSSVLWAINETPSDIAVGSIREILKGPDFIHEEFCNQRFRVRPFSFLQTNTHGAEKLYKHVREYVHPKQGGFERWPLLLDIYSGVGVMSILFSDLADKILGIESVPAAIGDARDNAKLNGIDTVEFQCGLVEKMNLGEEIERLGANPKDTCFLLDPPRAGVHPKLIKQILGLLPRHLVYVSCNPKTLANDLKGLIQGGYEIQRVQPIDLFPHTNHIEVVTQLSHV